MSCRHLTVDDEAGSIRDVLVVNGASGDAWTLVSVEDGTFRAAWRLELEPGEKLAWRASRSRRSAARTGGDTNHAPVVHEKSASS